MLNYLSYAKFEKLKSLYSGTMYNKRKKNICLEIMRKARCRAYRLVLIFIDNRRPRVRKVQGKHITEKIIQKIQVKERKVQ